MAGIIGWDWQTFIVSSASAVTIIIANNKSKFSRFLSLATTVPFFVIYAFGSINIGQVATYPIWIWGIITSLITSFLLQKNIRFLPTMLISLIIAMIGGILIFPNTFSYINKEQELTSFSLEKSTITDENNNKIQLIEFKGKVVLFDIWHSACSPCIKEFPKIQALYNKFKEDTLIKIVSLNIPLDRDSGLKAHRYTDKYDFEKIYFSDETEYQKFSEKIVPLILIMDKNLKFRYAGPLHTGWNIYINNAEKIINKLKTENE